MSDLRDAACSPGSTGAASRWAASFRLVLARVAMLVGISGVLGEALSIWARFVATLLYGLQPRDPLTLIAATLELMVVGGLAGLIPARRAARLDPASVVRQG